MDTETKKLKRRENKKRKIAALLAVSELNDKEKSSKKQKIVSEDIKDCKPEDENENTIKDIANTGELVTKYASNSFARISDKPLLEGEEYEELRKRLRERKKALSCLPLFRMKSVGEDASLSLSKRVPLFMSDIQHLITYCMVGDRAPYWPHRWSVLTKWNRLSNLVVLVMDGVGLEDYNSHTSDLTWFPKHLPNLVEVVSPLSYHSTVAEELALLPLTVTHKKKLIEQFGSLESALEKDEAFKAFRSIFPVKTAEGDKKKEGKEEKKEGKEEQKEGEEKEEMTKGSLKLKLLLSATQMVTENYPLPLSGTLAERFQHYKLTSHSYEEVSPDSPLFSVDCEMCLTDEGSELTRICVVDSTLAVVYHTLVKPRNKIRNYLTQYSGITEEMLDGVTTRLEDVQKALQDLLPSDAILVGQSLNSDLFALQMMHPYVIDTSVCFNITGDRRRKTKLSVLAHLFLNRKIQNQGKLGHNPIEDAQAAMNLVVLKLSKGLEFGDVVLGGAVPRMDEQGIYNIPKDRMSKHENLMTSLSKTLGEQQKSVGLLCDKVSAESYAEFKNFKSELKLLKTDLESKEAVEEATASAVEHNLTICHINLGEFEPEERIKKTKKFSKKLFECTSLNGMFLTVFGGDARQNAVAGIVIKKAQDG